MDPTTLFTITQMITTTQIISGSLSVGTSAVMLAANPAQVFGVMVGWFLVLALFLFVNKFAQWALILALIGTLVWVPFSITGLSVLAAGIVLFGLMMAALLRTLSNFMK